MANYYAHARTNYFEVKDKDAFEEAMAGYEVTVVKRSDDLYGLLGCNTDSGCLPNWDEEKEEELDFPQIVAPHLADGHVAIFMEAGAEKLRYVHGQASAINNEGEERFIYLSEIMKLANELGEHVTEPQY